MKIFPLLVLCLSLAQSARAELLGVVDGRGARLSQQASKSVDLGITWYTPQLQWLAARMSVKPATGFLAYVDIAQIHGNDLPVSANASANFNGAGFGGGMLFSLPKWFNRYDLAFKIAYHSAVIDESNTSQSSSTQANAVSISDASKTKLEQSQWIAELAFSPIDPIFENGVSWYGTAGYFYTNAQLKVRQSLDDSVDYIGYRAREGAVLGAGLIKPSRRGKWYLGLKWFAGEPMLGVGFRYTIR